MMFSRAGSSDPGIFYPFIQNNANQNPVLFYTFTRSSRYNYVAMHGKKNLSPMKSTDFWQMLFVPDILLSKEGKQRRST